MTTNPFPFTQSDVVPFGKRPEDLLRAKNLEEAIGILEEGDRLREEADLLYGRRLKAFLNTTNEERYRLNNFGRSPEDNAKLLDLWLSLEPNESQTIELGREIFQVDRGEGDVFDATVLRSRDKTNEERLEEYRKIWEWRKRNTPEAIARRRSDLLAEQYLRARKQGISLEELQKIESGYSEYTKRKLGITEIDDPMPTISVYDPTQEPLIKVRDVTDLQLKPGLSPAAVAWRKEQEEGMQWPSALSWLGLNPSDFIKEQLAAEAEFRLEEQEKEFEKARRTR